MRFGIAVIGALVIGIPLYVISTALLGIVGKEPWMSICFIANLLVAGVFSYWGIPHLAKKCGTAVNMMAGGVRKIFGMLSLLMGVIILGWAIYNLFYPTKEFESNFRTIGQLGVPIAMITVGWFWLTSKAKTTSWRFPCFVFARIFDPITPLQRQIKYDEPLNSGLAECGLGEVDGGGTSITDDECIEWIGLDIYLADFDDALQFVRLRLRDLGAPRGSVLEYNQDGKEIVLPIN
jgi:uncharacterized protein YjeT (DUF2065 family)